MSAATTPDGPGGRAVLTDRLDGLLERAAGGDTEAFATLYAETVPWAFTLAFQLLRDRHLAEDATQEAYLRIWRTADRFERGRGTSLGWISMIVRRTAISHVRTTQARHVRDDRHTQGLELVQGRDGDPTHEQTYAALATERALEALAGLSPAQRQALELAYFGDHTHREVAALLDVPLGTVKTRIRDGLICLRRSLHHLQDAHSVH